MTEREFEILLQSRMEKIRSTLSKKAGEYATGGDRLHNFKKAAGLIRETLDPRTPAQVCMGFALKHIVSITDIVAGLSKGKDYGEDFIDEKIGDAINYLILLESLIKEDEVIRKC